MSKAHQSKRFDSHLYEKKIQDLLEKIDILESKLKLCGKDKIRFVQAFSDLEKENTFLKSEIEKRDKDNSSLEEAKVKFQNQINTLTEQHKSMIDTYKMKFDLLTRELQQKSNEIEKLIEDLKEKDDKIKYITVNSAMTMRFSDTFQDDLEKQKFIVDKQKKRINELEKEINDLYISKKSEGNLMLENEHLKDDNIRLLQMLKSTNEYHDFGFLNQTLPGGIRYVNDDAPLLKKTHHECERRKKENQMKRDNSNWIPSEAYNIVLEYKKRHNIEIDDKLINDLLASLNKVWRERESKQMNRIKTKYQRELITIRRKQGISAYSTVDTKKFETCKTDDFSKGLIENVKSIAKNFNDTKKGLEQTIDSLKNKIIENTYNKTKQSKEIDVTKTNELIINRALNEIQQIENHFEELLNQYKERVKDTETMIGETGNPIFNIKMINNSVKWLITSLREVLSSSRKKFEIWKNEYDKRI